MIGGRKGSAQGATGYERPDGFIGGVLVRFPVALGRLRGLRRALLEIPARLWAEKSSRPGRACESIGIPADRCFL